MSAWEANSYSHYTTKQTAKINANLILYYFIYKKRNEMLPQTNQLTLRAVVSSLTARSVRFTLPKFSNLSTKFRFAFSWILHSLCWVFLGVSETTVRALSVSHCVLVWELFVVLFFVIR